MAIWVKALLWIGLVLLPGGLLLAPVLYAFHRGERRARVRSMPVGPAPLAPQGADRDP